MTSDLTPPWTHPYGLPPERGLPAEVGLSPDLDDGQHHSPAGRPAADVSSPADTELLAPVLPPARQALPAPPDPSVVAVSEPAPAGEQVTCPECGLAADVILNRRDSQDFCRGCDYPLFWVPNQILLGRVDNDAASLRRLPGTLGRTTVASLECPHCEELNVVTADYCIRCGGDLHPAPPPVPVVYVPEPEPLPETEPEGTAWWAWVIIAVAVLMVLATLFWFAIHPGG